MTHAASKQNRCFTGETNNEIGAASCHSVNHSGENGFWRYTRRAQADHFRFGKHGTHAADGVWLHIFGDIVELFDAGSQRARNHLQKTPGACRAFVIHQEVAQVTVVIKLNDFAVLPTDVDHRSRCWRKKPCAKPVAGDFCHLFIGKIHQLPPIAGER